ncbi:hypothetical protein [Streptomyces nigrescens]
MDTYAHGYGSTGHYAKPGTHVSYCGRELQHTPNTGIAARICTPCAKAEKRDRVEAEQVAADRATNGPTLAERASVRYATVGTGRRIHYSPGNDDTLCGREITEYVCSDLLALLNKGRELCTPCIKAAEKRAHDRALAAKAEAEVEQADPLDTLLADVRELSAQADTQLADIREAAAELDILATEIAAWGAEVDALTEAQQAVTEIAEAEAADGTWRGEWIGQQADDGLFVVELPAEQGALFDDRATEAAAPAAVEERRAPIAVRASFRGEDLDRIRAKAEADRAAHRDEFDARRAAEAARHAPEPRAVEGVIVEHAGTAEGSTPANATHPNVIAARAALDGLAAARMTDHHDVTEPAEDEQDVRGYLINPREGERVAVYWLEGGRIIRRDTPWHGPALDCLADRLRRRGWKVEKMLTSSLCVFAHRPAND